MNNYDNIMTLDEFADLIKKVSCNAFADIKNWAELPESQRDALKSNEALQVEVYNSGCVTAILAEEASVVGKINAYKSLDDLIYDATWMAVDMLEDLIFDCAPDAEISVRPEDDPAINDVEEE